MLGVISDTHGLLRPEVFPILSGVDRILHAGDIGPPEILVELATIAPVDAVYGNTDRFPLVSDLPETRILPFEDRRIYLTHILPSLDSAFTRWALQPGDIVIFGHSHQPLTETYRKVHFFNPGSAGPRRFRLPISLGKLSIKSGEVRMQLIPILGA